MMGSLATDGVDMTDNSPLSSSSGELIPSRVHMIKRDFAIVRPVENSIKKVSPFASLYRFSEARQVRG